MKTAPIELLMVREVAEMLDLSHVTVLRLIRQRQIGYVKIGCRYRIPVTALIRFVEKRTVYEIDYDDTM